MYSFLLYNLHIIYELMAFFSHLQTQKMTMQFYPANPDASFADDADADCQAVTGEFLVRTLGVEILGIF